jgi:DNA repair exonuclease SbcCD ATPase subunit
MKLSLRNFRCYKKHDVDIKPGTVLLRGDSGSGKSTILEAIDYVLYGKLKQQYSHGEKSCSVRMEFTGGNVWIHRFSGPGKIKLFLNDTLYEGDDAEALISQTYNTREVFMACSYLKQGERCALMTGTNAEKMSLVRAISFHDENVEEIQNRIRSALKVCQEKVKTAEGEFNLANSLLQAFDKREPKIVNFPSEKLANLNLSDLKTQCDSLEIKIKQAIDEKSVVAGIEAKIETLEKFLQSEPVTTETSDLEDVEKRIKEVTSELETLRNEKAKRQASAEFFKFREQMEKEVLSISAELEEVKKKITIPLPNIPSEMDRIKKNLRLQDRIDSILKLHSQPNIQELRAYSSVLAGEIRTLRTMIMTMEKDLDSRDWNEAQLRTLVCPQCSSSLQMNEGKLCVLVSDYKPVLRDLTYPNITRAIIDEKKKEAELMEAKKNSIQTSQSDLNNLIKDLNFHDPNDIDKITTYEKYTDCSRRLKESEKRLESSKSTISEEIKGIDSPERETFLKADLNSLHQKRAEGQDFKARSKRRSETLLDLDSQKSILAGRNSAQITILLKDSQDSLSEKKELLSSATKCLERRELADTYDTKNKSLNILSKEAQNLSSLLERARQVEIQALEISVALLNIEIEKYLNIMFPDGDMSATFKTIRESKSKPDAKTMTCSMSIFYRNVDYGSGKLSGGEYDRVSLAMMLALNNLMGSNLILLDETLNTLDRNAKIQIVEMLKQIVGDSKMCLLISHEGVEGIFDATIHC